MIRIKLLPCPIYQILFLLVLTELATPPPSQPHPRSLRNAVANFNHRFGLTYYIDTQPLRSVVQQLPGRESIEKIEITIVEPGISVHGLTDIAELFTIRDALMRPDRVIRQEEWIERKGDTENMPPFGLHLAFKFDFKDIFTLSMRCPEIFGPSEFGSRAYASLGRDLQAQKYHKYGEQAQAIGEEIARNGQSGISPLQKRTWKPREEGPLRNPQVLQKVASLSDDHRQH